MNTQQGRGSWMASHEAAPVAMLQSCVLGKTEQRGSGLPMWPCTVNMATCVTASKERLNRGGEDSCHAGIPGGCVGASLLEALAVSVALCWLRLR